MGRSNYAYNAFIVAVAMVAVFLFLGTLAKTLAPDSGPTGMSSQDPIPVDGNSLFEKWVKLEDGRVIHCLIHEPTSRKESMSCDWGNAQSPTK